MEFDVLLLSAEFAVNNEPSVQTFKCIECLVGFQTETENNNHFLNYHSEMQLFSEDEIEKVVLQCQHSKKLRELWEDFQKFWLKKVKCFNFTHFALAFELCTNTLADSRAVRVHAHACCRAGHPVHIEKSELLSWQGTEPHMSQPFGVCRQRAAGSNACFFYLQCPKIGVVYQDANIKPFVDYLVSGEWVFNLLQQNKIMKAG